MSYGARATPPAATSSSAGTMSAGDKAKLDALPATPIDLPDGEYVTGIGGTQNGTLTVSGGQITAATEATP